MISSSLMKAAIAGAAAVLVLARIRSSKDYNASSFGFAFPKLVPFAGFTAAYLVWMLASDSAVGWRGPWDFGPWRQAPLMASALRLVAVCILGPIAEELAFRSLFF